MTWPSLGVGIVVATGTKGDVVLQAAKITTNAQKMIFLIIVKIKKPTRLRGFQYF